MHSNVLHHLTEVMFQFTKQTCRVSRLVKIIEPEQKLSLEHVGITKVSNHNYGPNFTSSYLR